MDRDEIIDKLLKSITFNGAEFSRLYKALIDGQENDEKIDAIRQEMEKLDLIKVREGQESWGGDIVILTLKGEQINKNDGWLDQKKRKSKKEDDTIRLLSEEGAKTVKKEDQKFKMTTLISVIGLVLVAIPTFLSLQETKQRKTDLIETEKRLKELNDRVLLLEARENEALRVKNPMDSLDEETTSQRK